MIRDGFSRDLLCTVERKAEMMETNVTLNVMGCGCGVFHCVY